MSSLRSHEGYFMMDHRHAGGTVPDSYLALVDIPFGAGRGLYESATYTCSHCQYVVVIEPKRTRERAFCSGCNHRICDLCGAERARTGLCRTFNQVIEEYIESVLCQSVKEF